MPGIVGIFTKLPRAQAEPQLLRMVEALRHESFYETGTWIDEELGAYVGWAARKNSFDSGMPLRNERGNVLLVFSGEEYPAPGQIRELQQQGHRFNPQDASYLVHLYENDPAFPENLNGRFQGLLIDQSRATALLFNDRFGMHRLYYHQSPDAFYFAAEAKALLEVNPALRKADPQGLGEFASYGCVLENRTLFHGVRSLPHGSAWTFHHGALANQKTYFSPTEWENQTQLDEQSYYQNIREVFSSHLPRYFNGPQQAGMSVTGGFDTRMIMAWHNPQPEEMPCYTFGGMFRDCRDVTVGRRLARMCGQRHDVIPVAEEFLSRFPHYAARSIYLTDGCVDVSRSPDLYVQERAREFAPVRVAGTYGSEILRGIRALPGGGWRLAPGFKPEAPSPGMFQEELLSDIQRAEETYRTVVQGHPVSFAAFRQAPWSHYGVLALEQTQLAVRTPFLDNDLVRTAFRAPQSALASNDVSLRLIADGNGDLRRIRTDRGQAGEPGLFSMLSHTWQEFTFKAEYAYDYGMPQGVASVDHFFSALHLEKLFLGRHKFYHFRLWYRDALAGYVREMLLDPKTLGRPYLHPKAVENAVHAHLKGNRNYTKAIHKLLTLELIHRLFIDPR